MGLVIYDWLAGKAADERKILAAEGCGRCLVLRREYQKAVDSYRFALGHARSLLQDYEKSAADGALLKRLAKALNEAIRLRDRDLYGEDFSIYRDAEALRREKRDFADALGKYRALIKKFPETVYAEAGRLYAPLCLARLGKHFQAERDLSAFWKKDKYGLYRGEALLELGRIAVEYRVQPKLAQRYFDLLKSWLDDVPKQDRFVEKELSIRSEVRKVTTPPSTEKKVDFWGNVKKQKIKPGQLVNRKTCSWYLDEIREQCASFRGFLFFTAGKKKKALECYERILRYDLQSRRMHGSGISTNYSRLKWGLDHGYLYAYPVELALYNGRRRFAILLGDFYYVTKAFGKAESIFRRLLKGEFGKVRGAARDYPQLAVAACTYWTRGRDQAFTQYLKVLKRRHGTITEDRATYAAGNISMDSYDEAVYKAGSRLLRELAFSGRVNDYVYRAYITIATKDLIEAGKREEGFRMLERLPKSAGQWWNVAQAWLQIYREAMDENDKARSGGSRDG